MALSSVELIAGSGILANQGLVQSAALTTNIANYENQVTVATYMDVVALAVANNVGNTPAVSNTTLSSIQTLASNICPAITNVIPSAYESALGPLGNTNSGGFTGVIETDASTIMGGGDLSKFVQVFTAAFGYASSVNEYINSAVNSDSLANTFQGMDDLTTGSLSQVTTALGAFGQDLANLGVLINLEELNNLGDPAALMKQVINVAGPLPVINTALVNQGIPSSVVNDFVANGTELSPALQKLAYDAMTQITGSDLQQVKNVLRVTLDSVTNMAALLDPKQILPTSYPTLTVPTPDGLKGIYNSSGSVNTNLIPYFE